MGVSRTNYALDSQSVLVAKFMELKCIFKVLHLVQMMHLFVFVGVGICKKKSFAWKFIFLGVAFFLQFPLPDSTQIENLKSEMGQIRPQLFDIEYFSREI